MTIHIFPLFSALLAGVLLVGQASNAEDVAEAPILEEPISARAGKEEPALQPRAIIPPGRPTWLTNAEPRRFGDQWAMVTAGPYPTTRECEQELDSEIKKVSDEFMNEHLGSKLAAGLLNYSGADLRKKLAQEMLRYEETVTVSVGPRKQIHALVSFTDDFQRELQTRWNKVRQTSRLMQVGLISAVVLSLLATACGYFKVEHATHGARSANLQFASAGAILVIVVAGVGAARWLQWL